MWTYAVPLLMLGGCASLPMPVDGGSVEVKELVAQSEAQVRGVVAGLHEPRGDQAIAPAAASLDLARIAVAGEAALGLSGASGAEVARLAALGVTLGYCRDGLERIRYKLPDREAASRFARGEYALLCLAPLSVLAVR